MAETVTSPQLPLKIGRYRVMQELGKGGMGIVYLARDPFIDRLVAIKTSRTSPSKDPVKLEEFQQNFFSEARAAGRLTHPHIVSIYDASTENDFNYLVLEYIDGASLKKYCKKNNLLPMDKVVKVIFQCAKALDYAHSNGVIHRDVKPSNILISKKGEAKISDFGIATTEMPSAPKERDMESFTGSVSYSSPERLRNETITPQSDIFSLGVVMYELITGIRPFEAETDIATFYKITNTDPAPLKKHRPDVSDSIERIVMKALEKDPAKRYKSGVQLTSELGSSFDHLKTIDEEINFEEKFNALKKINFFKDFTSIELAEVLEVTQWFKFEAPETIISEGEIDDSFYVIIVGEAIVKKKGKPLAFLNQGDCFGEMAYLGKIKRTASIEALSDTILMKINSSVMDQTSVSTQLCFYKVFSTALIGRLNHTSEMLFQRSF